MGVPSKTFCRSRSYSVRLQQRCWTYSLSSPSGNILSLQAGLASLNADVFTLSSVSNVNVDAKRILTLPRLLLGPQHRLPECVWQGALLLYKNRTTEREIVETKMCL